MIDEYLIEPIDITRDVHAIRERVWHAACIAGRCRYTNPDVRNENPPSVDSTNTCGGYHGAKTMDAETGQPIWRWRPCVRHLAWWERRKAWLRTMKERHKGGTTAPAGYRA